MVAVFGENGCPIDDGMLAKQPRILAAERIIGETFLFQCLTQHVRKVHIIVVAHLAKRNEVGLQMCQFVHDGFETAWYERTFLPDIPLQNGELNGPLCCALRSLLCCGRAGKGGQQQGNN